MKILKHLGLFMGWVLCCCCTSSSDKIHPSRQNISESVYASGLVKSRNQYQVFANANGTVQDIYVTEGDTVKIGTPLLAVFDETTKLNREIAELAREYADRQNNMTRLRDLEINIDLAKTKLENDSLQWIRQKNLREQGIGSAIELEQRQLAYTNSRTAYQTAKLQYEELKREILHNEQNAAKNLEKMKAMENDLLVKSKINGKVYALLKEKGEMVNVQTPLAVLGSETDFILELQVDEYDIVKINQGQKVMVSMDSYRGQVYEAIITKINPMMDPASKSFVVEATFVETPPRLYPNLTLEANIIIRTSENALVVPRNYIYRDKFLITSEGDTIEVTLGITDFQRAEIVSGVNEGTELVRP
ncbi:efflux RND transporter periplasmic adaptor subunit [Negadavirga shengliensis]|uniref:Efflux RND transporter periplasmic adaptor subunit n=1 Tax=Negadavirga shengliensis TaxID=1389218 RepID=A0ABV9T8V1_9BACT